MTDSDTVQETIGVTEMHDVNRVVGMAIGDFIVVTVYNDAFGCVRLYELSNHGDAIESIKETVMWNMKHD